MCVVGGGGRVMLESGGRLMQCVWAEVEAHKYVSSE